MMEAGQRNPSLFVCHALAAALELDLADVIREAQKWLLKTRA